tara:strand:+ start:125 stop:349 length:225 start_codon:yes stop_codon:yes gene_type:complete
VRANNAYTTYIAYNPRMAETGSSVTLILYSLDKKWWTGNEPLLNIVAAAAQGSTFTHTELAIGEVSAQRDRPVV